MRNVNPESIRPGFVSEARAWIILGLLAVCYMNSFIDRMAIALLVEPIKSDLQITDTQIGLLQGFAFAFVYALMGIPIGRWVDTSNRKAVIVIGMTFWSLAASACGLAQRYWQLFLFRIGVGIGEASLSPAAYSMIADLFPKDKIGRANAIYIMGGSLGSGLALVLGAWVLAFTTRIGTLSLPVVGTLGPWQMTFLCLGLPGLLLVVAVQLIVKEPSRRQSVTETETEDRADFQALISQLKLRRSFYLPLFLSISCWATVTFGAYAWIPTLFIRKYAWDIGEIGFVYGTMNLTFAVTAPFLGGWLMDCAMRRSGLRGAFRIAIGILAIVVTLGLAPLSPGAELAVVLICLGTFAKLCFSVIPISMLMHMTPNRLRGQISAIYLFSVNMVGLTLGPLSVGLLTDYVFVDKAKIDASMAIIGCVAIPMSVAFLWLAGRATTSLNSDGHPRENGVELPRSTA